MKKIITLLATALLGHAYLFSQETLQSVTTNGSTTSNRITVETPNGGPMYTGRQMGAGYGFANPYAAIFYAKTDAAWPSNVYLFGGYHGTNSELGSGTNSFYVRGDGDGFFAGNVGIGNASPAYKLDVNGDINSSGYFRTGNFSPNMINTGNAIIGRATDENPGNLCIQLGWGTDRYFRVVDNAWTREIFTAGINTFSYNGNPIWHAGNFSPAAYFPLAGGDITGNVNIGTTSLQKDLGVNGNIKTRKVTVTQANWPDYVFDSTYRLIPLHQVEAFIKTNKHLPNVPSAAEVKKEGLDLGDNQSALLKKIEELTLYIIEQNKKMEAQELRSNVQQKQNEELGKRLSEIEKRMMERG